ncbi:MAG: diadenylate cyclase CdaA [Chloroflexota bacterium]
MRAERNAARLGLRSFVQEAFWLLSKLNLLAVLDILLVSLIIYGLLVLIRGTQADQVVRGALILLLASALVGSVFKLTIFNWLLQSIIPALLIAIPVIFQPELRRALEQLGRTGNIINYPLHLHITTNVEKLAEELARACVLLTERGYGGLVVLERTTGLEDIIQTGTRIDGTVTAELLLQIFYRGSPLHDGAVVIRDDRIVAARCLLPLTDDSELDPELGTRHRAALGVTENTDAVCIVVSEETASISLANHGHLVRHLNDQKLRLLLTALLQTPSGIRGLGGGGSREDGPEGPRPIPPVAGGPAGAGASPPSGGRPIWIGLGALGSLVGRRLGWRAGR